MSPCGRGINLNAPVFDQRRRDSMLIYEILSQVIVPQFYQ